MNPSELKIHLYQLVKKNGKSSITQLEYEYMTGKIDFNTYLHSCYVDCAKGPLSKNKKFRFKSNLIKQNQKVNIKRLTLD